MYKKYFIDRQFERLDLFQAIADEFNIHRVLYAGSFVHVTPSFVFPEVVYVDSDKYAQKFFGQAEVSKFIAQRKAYQQASSFQFHFADYREGFDEPRGSFDLLISQYAGLVGQHCKAYLKAGGLLLANNSPGDAGIAAMDEDYRLVAAFSLRNGKHRFSQSRLGDYFVPKISVSITRADLERLQKGIGYKKVASHYLFQRVSVSTSGR